MPASLQFYDRIHILFFNCIVIKMKYLRSIKKAFLWCEKQKNETKIASFLLRREYFNSE